MLVKYSNIKSIQLTKNNIKARRGIGVLDCTKRVIMIFNFRAFKQFLHLMVCKSTFIEKKTQLK